MNDLDVVLVQMPICHLIPSLALALLKQGLKDEGISCCVEYASHRFVSHLGYDYYRYADNALTIIANTGWEAAFAPSAGIKSAISLDEFLEIANNEMALYKDVLSLNASGKDLTARLIHSMRSIYNKLFAEIPVFLEKEAEYILSFNPKIVGLSVMTQQRNATFAMCRILKQKKPDIITIMGGGVCVGETAKQFLKVCPDLDYVFTGEGDRALARACRDLLAGNSMEEHPYMLSRGNEGYFFRVDDIDDNPMPDFSDYIKILEEDEFGDKIDRTTVVESSRGCWWAEKQRCRFCGLHYCKEAINYREKTPERFWEELIQINKRFGFTDFQMADCIISRKLISSLPDKCPEERKDFSLWGECRSDLSEADIKRLAVNGFTMLQPGIESLQDDILRLMSKGRKTVQQLLFMRRAMKYGIRCRWNIIYSIPGEKEEWYEEMLVLLKKLHHLDPPSVITPLLLARGSIFHTDAEQYGVSFGIRPADKVCSPDDPDYLLNVSDYFSYSTKRISREMESRLLSEGRDWNNDHRNGAALNCSFSGDLVQIDDLRKPQEPESFTLEGIDKDILMLSMDIVTMKSLSKTLGKTPESLEPFVRELEDRGLIYRKGEDIVCLACPI